MPRDRVRCPEAEYPVSGVDQVPPGQSQHGKWPRFPPTSERRDFRKRIHIMRNTTAWTHFRYPESGQRRPVSQPAAARTGIFHSCLVRHRGRCLKTEWRARCGPVVFRIGGRRVARMAAKRAPRGMTARTTPYIPGGLNLWVLNNLPNCGRSSQRRPTGAQREAAGSAGGHRREAEVRRPAAAWRQAGCGRRQAAHRAKPASAKPAAPVDPVIVAIGKLQRKFPRAFRRIRPQSAAQGRYLGRPRT